ncbi:hypothetical protein ACQR0V_25480 [Bradyrhizobium sp. HKCCYLS2058]|uniref:hypothetical protein n=1 Tax=unclassified Bradyrhizobium TaxID=2631580 RepID=UPI003EB6B03C
MKVDKPTLTWLIAASVAATLVLFCGFLRTLGIAGHGSLAATFILSVAVLLFFSLKLSSTRPRLNLTLAAETLVALGIFTLIISIMVVLLSVSEFMIEIAGRDLTLDDMRRFAWPFAEGLGAAAIAPFVATLLRHIEANQTSIDTGDSALADAARDAANLAEELRLATAKFRTMNTELTSNTDALKTAIAGSVKAATSLATMLQTESERLQVSFQRMQAEATGFGIAIEGSRVSAAGLATDLLTLKSSSKEATELLDALGKLIDSVDRYVRPDRTLA